MTTAASSRPQHNLSLFLFWLGPAVCLLVVYVLTRTQNHTAAEDALGYAVAVNAGYGPAFFHPNHLLFSFLCCAALQAARFCGYAGDAVPVMQTINAAAGAMSVVLLFNVARRVFGGIGPAATNAGALAISSAF